MIGGETTKKHLKPCLYLVLDTTRVVDNSDTGGIGSNVQALDDFGQKNLDLFKLWGANAATAVNDENQIRGASFAQTCRCKERTGIILLIVSQQLIYILY